jgi:addiction module RelB/DinJ family antitoxin
MKNKIDVINVMVNREVKEKATKVLKMYNISMTQAITLYLKEIINYNGIPFRIVKNPNK